MPHYDLTRTKGSAFATTRWSLVSAAGRTGSRNSADALAELCSSYWYPLYSYVRRKGYSVSEAQDLTQEFFLRLIEKNYLEVADRERGRFRSFLLASLNHFLSNERDRRTALKRGGKNTPISLDYADAERRYQLEPNHTQTPETIYEIQWATALLARVLRKLRQDFATVGKEELFLGLKVFLSDSRPKPTYSDRAADLGMTVGALKVAVHRLRHRYKKLLRDEIAQTVIDPAQIDDEIRALFQAFKA